MVPNIIERVVVVVKKMKLKFCQKKYFEWMNEWEKRNSKWNLQGSLYHHHHHHNNDNHYHSIDIDIVKQEKSFIFSFSLSIHSYNFGKKLIIITIMIMLRFFFFFFFWLFVIIAIYEIIIFGEKKATHTHSTFLIANHSIRQ